MNGVARPWDSVDAVQPFLENSAAFITTRVYTTPGQTIQDTGNPDRHCSSNNDCVGAASNPLNHGSCVNSRCQETAWAPMFSESDTTNTQLYDLVGADNYGIWIRSAIQFPSLDATRVFSSISNTQTTPYATHAASTPAVAGSSSTQLGDGSTFPPDYFTVGELLSLAQTSYDSIKREGCTIAVSYVWTCFVDASSTCHPVVNVARLDTNEKRRGFSYQYADYYRPTAGGASTRDLHTVTGVRLLISTRGEGKRVSISAIMLQISSGIALLWLANFAADFLMLHVLPERKHYRTYKQERTPDFSDLRNKIAEVEGEKKKLRDRKNRFAAKLDES